LQRDSSASWATSPRARRVMQGNVRRDTEPEMRIRRLLHRRGLRYRVDTAPLPAITRAKADLVFRRAQLAVFVDGCYWHGCPQHYVASRSNSRYWHEKIEANRARDRRVNTVLRKNGWTVLRVWEHEDPDAVAQMIASRLRS
jgi:DNA mismatch endonuclease (patch repair protein)